ncbi:Crescent membrane/immature virion protein [Eptesipox virus]|uniref:Crescent membrane/immature virion protein n=1 Tax=Eptesipox virus TaxID=1329402 RepID=A0A220T6F0_9POXV|nr:Crescent membrane/immature virion protein [Eptesipox virus]ASK51283.1 Crescent membrane/immature virion protein [Eptesipox virus]WAH71041.1 crescent membrane/immature virion protein [Eptesipox virus]
MDDKLKTLAQTFFSGELSTTDIMVLIIELKSIQPIDTIFSLDCTNTFVIDYLYENNVLASNYINSKFKIINQSEYSKYSAMIAKELTTYDIICEDIKDYINKNPKLKRVIKMYKCNSKNNNNKINKASKKLKIAIKKGIDYDYIKNAYI